MRPGEDVGLPAALSSGDFSRLFLQTRGSPAAPDLLFYLPAIGLEWQ
jgi:hypothetical protein